MKEISNDKENFENYLKTINRQIKDIEHLVNEFSDFARMPKPVLKRTNIKKIIDGAINLYALSSSKINLKLKCKKEEFTKSFVEKTKKLKNASNAGSFLFLLLDPA